MSINYQSQHFKKLIDIMMPDTSLFDGKFDPNTNLYRWHTALALCLKEINDVVYQGWLDYFVDTASSDSIRTLADEINVPDSIFRDSSDIEVLRANIKGKNRILNGVITEPDLIEIASMFKIDKIKISHGDDFSFIDEWIFENGENNEDLGLKLYSEDDEPHGFLTIHLPSNLTNDGVVAEYAKRFEILVNRIKSSYVDLTFVYDL